MRWHVSLRSRQGGGQWMHSDEGGAACARGVDDGEDTAVYTPVVRHSSAVLSLPVAYVGSLTGRRRLARYDGMAIACQPRQAQLYDRPHCERLLTRLSPCCSPTSTSTSSSTGGERTATTIPLLSLCSLRRLASLTPRRVRQPSQIGAIKGRRSQLSSSPPPAILAAARSPPCLPVDDVRALAS